MPEILELEAAEYCLSEFLFNEPESERVVEAIFVDATNAEQSKHPKSSLARAGQVYELTPSSKIQRGQRGAQSKVFPPKYATSVSNDTPKTAIAVHELTLMQVESNPRNVFLRFVDKNKDSYWAQVSQLKCFGGC